MHYAWKVTLTGVRPQQGQQSIPLEEDVNRLEDEGYEIYTILPMETEGVAFAIVAGKSAERARWDAITRGNRRTPQRMRSIPMPGGSKP
jgi:hypothetical protein